MKLNGKIKRYRKIFNLSQEQLAEKLNVSRQAITKWESGKGIPDVENLKPLANLFGVSIDYLLNEEEEICNPVLKEDITIEGKNNFNNRYDYVVKLLKERYPSPNKIYGLSQSRQLSKLEWWVDLLINPGIIDMIHYLNEFAIWFLVQTETENLLIKVTKDKMETMEISSLIDTKKFVVEKNKFILTQEIK